MAIFRNPPLGNSKSWGLLIVSAMIGLCWAACRATYRSASEQEAIDIYQAAIQKVLAEEDDVFPGREGGSLYIVRSVVSSADGRLVATNKITYLVESIERGLAEKLAGLPFCLVYVNKFEDVALDPRDGSPVHGGIVLSLGQIQIHRGKAYTYVNLYHGNLAAIGRTYILERKDDVWVVTGDAGGSWIS